MSKKGRTTQTIEEWETEEKLEELYNLAKRGLINTEIAKAMGISETTIYKWMEKSELIANTIKEGKSKVDNEVVSAAFKNAMGYEYYEETEELVDGIMQVTKRVKKVAPPNSTMQIYWMKNRLDKDWKDSQLTDTHKRKLELENMILEKTLEKLDGKDMDTSMLDSLTNLFKKK